MSFDFNREQVKLWQKIDELYAIDRTTQLGKGSYGQIYRGYSYQRDCLIALKIVKQHEKSMNELSALESLSLMHHQYVMSYYGHTIKGNQIYLLFQYFPQGTLKSLLRRRLTQLEVLRLFRQIVEGMCYINAKKTMQLGIRPEKILIGPEQDIKISDFRITQLSNSLIVTHQKAIPIYEAPEVYLNASKTQKKLDKCDIWSTGLILYEMLTGENLLKNAQQQKSSKLLKQQWIQFHKGLKVINLGLKYHPLWNYFINWLLDFDASRRPTFAIILQSIKSIYKLFAEELQKGVLTLHLPLERFENYVQFNISKYQILVQLCELFTSRDFSIRNQFKYMIIFCCLMRYISFTKLFVKDLKSKKLKFNNQELIDQEISKHPYLDMLIKKNEILLYQRYDYYSQQLKVTILPKILNTYRQRQQSQPILRELNHILDMVAAISKGQPNASEQHYQSAMKSILPVIQKFHNDVTTYFKQDQLRIYYEMLITMQISERYPVDQFMKKQLFQDEKSRIRGLSLNQLVKEINSLNQHIF